MKSIYKYIYIHVYLGKARNKRSDQLNGNLAKTFQVFYSKQPHNLCFVQVNCITPVQEIPKLYYQK